MKGDLIDFLKRFDSGEIPNSLVQNNSGFHRAKESEAIKLDNESNMWVLTASGYDLLQRWYVLDATRDLNESVKKMDSSSTKISKEMLKHTRTVTKLTWWMIGFTIVNMILVGVQIWIALVNK